MRARISAAILLVLLLGSIASAAGTSKIIGEGNFNATEPLSEPLRSPASFAELAASSIHSASVDIIDPAHRAQTLTFFFWHTAERVISVRVYVDAAALEGTAGLPVLVGFGDFRFAQDGRKFSSGGSSDFFIDVAWPESAASRIAVIFNTATLLSETTSVTVSLLSEERNPAMDFDGDRRDDMAIYRPEFGLWAIRLSSAPGMVLYRQWGLPGDYPIAGDYTGDGLADLVIWRPSEGNWYICNSEVVYDCFADGFGYTQFGLVGDRPLRGDYDGDGIFDLALWRPSLGLFIYFGSLTRELVVTQWGVSGDIPLGTLPNE